MRNTQVRLGGAAAAAAVAALGGCHRDHHQSMLHPAGPAAGEIAWLWWFLLAVCTAVFVAVLVLLALAIRRRPGVAPGERPAAPPLSNRFIVVTGILIPAVILTVILLVSVRTQVALSMPDSALTIRVVGHMWWWEVHYPDQGIEIANELYIPVGEPVRVELVSADVIHSFWVPNLQGKMDLLPDKTNVTWLLSERPGTFRGQCAEYCGIQHALMAFVVVALPRDEFDAWIAERQSPPEVEETDSIRRGREVFFGSACHNCHAIAGSEAVGLRGPDLTHLGNRRTLGAGIIPNNRGNLMGWISNPQAIKPGNLMPRTHIPAEDLHALVDYLESLK